MSRGRFYSPLSDARSHKPADVRVDPAALLPAPLLTWSGTAPRTHPGSADPGGPWRLFEALQELHSEMKKRNCTRREGNNGPPRTPPRSSALN